MTKSKRKWAVILIILLVFICVICYIIESAKFAGLKILSKDDLSIIVENMKYMESFTNADDFLLLNKDKVAYDKYDNIFYVSHVGGKTDFSGIFDSNSLNCNIYIEKDNMINDLETAIETGHEFKIWIVTDEAYTISKMVFTGLPVMTLSTFDILSQEYGNGYATLTDACDIEVKGFSIKASNALIKCNPNSETYSLKLVKADYIEEKKLNFAGLGKRSNWKLYKVSDNDKTLMRAKLASDVWNLLNLDSSFQRNYEFVEVVVNKDYKGLYLMAPKWTQGYLDLADGSVLVETENMTADMYEQLDKEAQIDNIVQYLVFLQITCAHKNVSENNIYIKNIVTGNEYLIPDKLEYAFGGFSDGEMYKTWKNTSNHLIDEALCIFMKNELDENIKVSCKETWRHSLGKGIDSVALTELVRKYEKKLTKSGIISRLRIEEYSYYCTQLEKYISERFEMLDNYYQ